MLKLGKNKRAIAMAAATLAIAGGATIGLGGTANAAAYDGQDPIATGCNQTAYTAESAPVYRNDGTQVGTMELRYSLSCGTVWARVVSFYSTGYAYAYRYTDGASQKCGNTLTWSSSLGAYSCYTRMLNDLNATSYAWGGIDTVGGWSQLAFTAAF